MNTPNDSVGGPRSVTYIRVAAITPFVEHLQNSGILLPPLLARHRILTSELSDPYSVIPLHRFVAFLEDAAEATGDLAFGARLGAHFKPADIGPMGILFSVAPTVRVAFERISKYVNSLQSATSSSLTQEDDVLVWSYRISDRSIWPRRQDAEYSVAATCQLARTCFKTNLNPLEVHFEHDRPENIEPLRRLFRAPLYFSQPSNRLVYAVEDADRVYRSEDTQLTMILEHHLEDLIHEVKAKEVFSDKVRFLIQLYMGRRPVTTHFLAEELGISVRTLQRRLEEEGLSIRDLMRAHREEVAVNLLERPGARMSNIAQALGYADSAVFSRAFKEWTGLAPRKAAKGVIPRADTPGDENA
ncbi:MULTISPECIES: AraC family transcriptional regulator [Alphaproteobacteria]|uniref:AraC family transcriptional regulator n=2 Tax=Alphaproteobacteria TaxID=28211 RepID=A0A512HH17_9HYPH|nr:MULTISPECIES: AraC family transcriptional regulator [Alphaproteobacteria]GEO84732.1 AraC family transcriptional regulator [Ciceribacter naphthalenivorans]GLR20647.1 AraC family transcriptional regulator [Ciceribacter naphthalenivorans]GLT03503.1 AraC family transcriptional regulator [Sphingomonas psychrolutea]